MKFSDFVYTRRAASMDHELAQLLIEGIEFNNKFMNCFIYEFEGEQLGILKRALYTYQDTTVYDFVVPLPGGDHSFRTLDEAENCLWCEYCNCGE